MEDGAGKGENPDENESPDATSDENHERDATDEQGERTRTRRGVLAGCVALLAALGIGTGEDGAGGDGPSDDVGATDVARQTFRTTTPNRTARTFTRDTTTFTRRTRRRRGNRSRRRRRGTTPFAWWRRTTRRDGRRRRRRTSRRRRRGTRRRRRRTRQDGRRRTRTTFVGGGRRPSTVEFDDGRGFDSADQVTGASRLRPPVRVVGRIRPGDDVDYFAIHLRSGETLRIQPQRLRGGIVWSVFDPEFGLQGFRFRQRRFTADETGYHYLRVESRQNERGRYELTIRVQG